MTLPISAFQPQRDSAPGKGVVTDVVIRAYRNRALTFNKRHEDMAANFGSYPKIWDSLKRIRT